jgi:hypothetical protein
MVLANSDAEGSHDPMVDIRAIGVISCWLVNDKKLYYPIIRDYLTHIRETYQPTNSYNDLISKAEKANRGTRTDEFHHPQAWLDTPKIMEFTFQDF